MALLHRTLLFVHVPKTAGTSFRVAATECFGAARCALDYGPTAPETSPLLRDATDPWRVGQALAADPPALLAGHFPAARYAGLFPLMNVVAFLRDPLDQLRSHYLHQCRDNGYQAGPEAFAKGAMGAGFQPRLLAAAPLEAYGFIGLTERYAESLAQFNAVHGLDLPVRQLNPRPDGDGADPLPPAVVQAFRRQAQADLQLIARAQRALDARIRLQREGLPFTHGALQGREPHHLPGFAFRRDGDAPVTVELLVNDRLHASQQAVRDRPGLRALNAPRGGYVGFNFHFDGSVAGPGDTLSVRVADSGQWLGAVTLPEPVRR